SQKKIKTFRHFYLFHLCIVGKSTPMNNIQRFDSSTSATVRRDIIHLLQLSKWITITKLLARTLGGFSQNISYNVNYMYAKILFNESSRIFIPAVFIFVLSRRAMKWEVLLIFHILHLINHFVV